MIDKKAVYAAVGAPMVTARRAADMLKELSEKMTGRITDVSEKLTEDAKKEYDQWVKEGEKVVGKISEQKVVEDLSARVDLDDLQERVGKLRDQLEDILSAWRSSFNPEEIKAEVVKVVEEAKPAAKKAPAKKTAPAAKKAPAKKTAAKPAAKKAPVKKTAAKPAAKKPATV